MALDTPFRDAEDCFRWLYGFGARPVVIREGCLPQAPVLTEAQRALLGRQFVPVVDTAWERWLPEDWDVAKPPRHKLYICPTAATIQGVISALIPAMCTTDGFKIVAKCWMLGRTDCLVLYFKDRDKRSGWIKDNTASLNAITGSQVPFTQPVSGLHAVTIATDPDVRNQSWRSCLLRSVARYIIKAQANADPLQCVLRALEREGIDYNNWCMHD